MLTVTRRTTAKGLFIAAIACWPTLALGTAAIAQKPVIAAVWRVAGGQSLGACAVANLAGDSVSIVAAYSPAGRGMVPSGGVWCLDLAGEGRTQWSFPKGAYGFSVWGTPAIADVDGQPGMEVIAVGMNGIVYCLDGHDGNPLWRFATSYTATSSPAAADLDQDGQVEVVVTSRDGYVYCLDGKTGLRKWATRTDGEVDSSPAIASVHDSPGQEVVVGSDDGFLYCLAGPSGEVLWRVPLGWSVSSSPVVADLEGDGSPEVLVGCNDGRLYCLRGSDGAQRWSFQTSAPVASSVAATDLVGDGSLEVLFGSDAVYCLDSTGHQVWRYANGNRFNSSPVIADLEGRGQLDVVFGGDELTSLDARTGQVRWRESQPEATFFNPLLVRIPGEDAFGIVVSTTQGGLALYRVLGSGGGKAQWGKFRGDLGNTGWAPAAWAYARGWASGASPVTEAR